LDIVDRINQGASTISEADIETWVVPKLLSHYSDKISALCREVYGYPEQGASVALGAFKQQAEQAIRKGITTFLFKTYRWRAGMSVGPYLLTCLNRLADRIKSDVESIRKIGVPVCPACKSEGRKEFLFADVRGLICQYCSKESVRLEDEADSEISQCFHDIFSAHSKKGYRCPKCERFIPDSYVRSYLISCPYPTCNWFGTSNEIELMLHPTGMSSEHLISLDVNYNDKWHGDNPGKTHTWKDNVADVSANADIKMEVVQRYDQEYEVIRTVILTQMERVLKEKRTKSIKKQLMYQAYLNVFERQPEDMIAYLAHLKHAGDLPIQSQIFQEFVRLVENALPFTIEKHGTEIEVLSLLDPYLDLFLGISNFTETVKLNRVVPNGTNEIYVGGRRMRDFGPCFIGMLCSVRDELGNDLFKKVVYYTFSHIKMADSVEPGTVVKVSHLRIPSHYEMLGLVQLQRTRRRIVDSVYQRLHGVRRIIGVENVLQMD
jgi:hypothetical protein